MKVLFFVIVLSVSIVGCQVSPTLPPTTSSLTPTVTPWPTFTPFPTWAPASSTPTPIANPQAYAQAERLGRGVNLGNALEAPNEGEWGMVLEEEFFQLIAGAGFDTIRVPIRWSTHALEDPPYTVDQVFFERVDWVIEHGLAQGLNVVINMHHYEEIFEEPDAHAERFVAIWTQIAARYKDLPDSVYFEPLNEPNGNLNAEKWNVILSQTVSAIRKIEAGRHTLIFGGAEWGGIDGLATLRIPNGETNFVATFHFYDPFLFTHQGAEWADAWAGTLGVVWPGPPETKLEPIPEAREVDWVYSWFIRYNQASAGSNPAGPKPIRDAFDRAAAWSEARGVPLWLGEFGAYSKADMQSRVNWTAFVREEAEAHGFSWAYWEFGAGFGVYDRETRQWRAGLLNALVPAEGQD
jgi:endoglucanase